MLLIQVVVVGFALIALARTLLRFRQRSMGYGALVLWAGFWIAAGVVVVVPEVTQWVASLLGVGRGADAVFYLGLVVTSWAFFRVYLRFQHMEQQLTTLVRRLALDEARRRHEG